VANVCAIALPLLISWRCWCCSCGQPTDRQAGCVYQCAAPLIVTCAHVKQAGGAGRHQSCGGASSSPPAALTATLAYRWPLSPATLAVPPTTPDPPACCVFLASRTGIEAKQHCIRPAPAMRSVCASAWPQCMPFRPPAFTPCTPLTSRLDCMPSSPQRLQSTLQILLHFTCANMRHRRHVR
jgi:hypothetical protein